MKPFVDHWWASLFNVALGSEVIDVDDSDKARVFKCVEYDPFAFDCKLPTSESTDLTCFTGDEDIPEKQTSETGKFKICGDCGRKWLFRDNKWITLMFVR